MEIYNPRKERGGQRRRGGRDGIPEPRPAGGTKLLLGLGWVVVAVLLLLSIFGETGLLQLVRQAEKRRQAEEEVTALRAEIASLRQEVERLQTSREFVRELARDGGFVRDNEVVILLDNVPAPGGAAAGRGAAPSGGPVGTPRNR